MIVVATADKDI